MIFNYSLHRSNLSKYNLKKKKKEPEVNDPFNKWRKNELKNSPEHVQIALGLTNTSIAKLRDLLSNNLLTPSNSKQKDQFLRKLAYWSNQSYLKLEIKLSRRSKA